MTTFRQIVELSNARMDEIARNPKLSAHDRAEEAHKIWHNVAERIRAAGYAPSNPAAAAALGADYIGATADGAIVCWGEEREHHRTFQIV